MGRGLGPQQSLLLDLLASRRDGMTVAQVADHRGLSERRARTVITTLADRGKVGVIVEQVGTQDGGAPVHGLTVRAPRLHDDVLWRRQRTSDVAQRRAADEAAYERRIAVLAHRAAALCPCCGQPLPLG